MALFMGIHNLPNADDEKVNGAWDGYKVSCDKHSVDAKHLYYSVKKGVGYCFTEADSEEEVRKAHEGMAVPVEDVFEVKTLTYSE